MFFITTSKNSRKVKINRNYVSKYNLYLHFLIYQNLLISREKMLMSAELQVCVTWFIYFLNLLCVRYNCQVVGYVWQILQKGGLFVPLPPAIREQPRKSLSWIGLKKTCNFIRKRLQYCKVYKHLFWKSSVNSCFCKSASQWQISRKKIISDFYLSF